MIQKIGNHKTVLLRTEAVDTASILWRSIPLHRLADGKTKLLPMCKRDFAPIIKMEDVSITLELLEGWPMDLGAGCICTDACGASSLEPSQHSE